MLRFNTFRSRRYLRTKFVEGAFLLASEASDLELEIIDLLRASVRSTLGDVAFGDAWKVERLSDTSILIKPGEAWFDGLPFELRSAKDQLVSGAILSLGSVPVGVTSEDDTSGLGKIINFNDGNTTPTNDYRIIVAAREELVTDVDDPFLKNVNLTESTAQKVRLNFQINIVPVSSQSESSTPYRDESSTSGSATNYPDTGNFADPNLQNRLVVTPSAAGNGEQISITALSGSEGIDGRDLEIVVRNDPGVGSGNPFPNSPGSQQAFSNGKLIDSNGTEYHVNAIFNDNVSTQLVIRIDKEPDQPNPELVNGSSYILEKRNVYATDDVNGSPQGVLYWSIADISWDSSDLLNHSSQVTDLRNTIENHDTFQEKSNIKDNLILTNGGTLNFTAATGLLTSSADFSIVNPFGPENTIDVTSVNMLDGASLVYEMDFASGGAIEKGTLALNITAGGTTITVDPVTYSNIDTGNVIVDSGGTLAYVVAVDATNDQIEVSTALTTGAATLYRDQYENGFAPLSSTAFHLVTRKGNKLYFFNGILELEDGETSEIGDGLTSEILTFIGATSETDDSPVYSSTTVVTQNNPLTDAISELDGGLDATNTELDNLRTYTGADDGTDTTPDYSSDIRGTANESLEARAGVLTDNQGDSQEDRSAYLRSDDVVTWTGTDLEFNEDIILEIINTKSGTTTTHTVDSGDSPVSIGDGESLYVSIDRTTASETISLINSGTTPIPAQTQANKDIFVLFKRIDVSGEAFLHLPFLKQVLTPGQTVRLGAAGGGGTGFVKVDFIDPISTALPTGSSVTIDGVSGSNGDLVLYTNLSSNNNRIYELSGVGSSIAWDAQRAFSGQFDPTDGDTVIATQGDAFQEQVAIFDGTDFKVNDVVRLFDGVSGNFWELGSIKNTTLTNNSVDSVFEVNVSGSENIIVSYSISRGSNKETGELYITSDGTDAQVSRNASYISDVGVEFTADVTSGDLRLRYTTTNTGDDANMKYFLRRWSDSVGGPTGVPNYSGASGGSVSAAGTVGDIQYHGAGGLLAGDNRFKWDSSGFLDLDGQEITLLSSGTTINDNQASAAVLFSYAHATYPNAIIDYSIERNGEIRTGTIHVAANASTAADNDLFVETASTGVTLSADINGANVEIRYTSTSTGFTGTFKYTIRRWS